MEEVKKRSKKEDFYLSVFNLIKKGLNPISISQRLNISKQNIQYYLNFLKNNGFIKKIGYGTWEVKKEVKTFSLGTKVDKPTTNLHALQINIPILSGKIDDSEWKINEKLNHWIPKYKGLNILGGLNIKNNNNRSITVFVKSRDIISLDEVDNLSFKIRAYTNEYFKNKGIILDIFNSRVTNLNLATQDRDAEGMIRKGEKFELDLNKKAEKVFELDNIKAKAWIDGSPFKFSAETNDKEWKRWYLGMPFMIRDMFILQESMTEKLVFMAKNQESHAKAIKELTKLAKTLNEQLEQESLRKWL